MSRVGRTAALVASIALVACEQTASSHPSPSTVPPSPTKVVISPQAVIDGADFWNTPGQKVSVTIIDIHGAIVATTQHQLRSEITVGAWRAALLPYDSVSRSRVYFLDGDSTVRSLDRSGQVQTIRSLPGSSTAHAGFAVSPDDALMAVSVIDYATSPPTLHLSVGALDGAGDHEIFSSQSVYVWPVGWHSGKLVVAAGPAFSNVVDYNLLGPVQEYHVVDPASAERLMTLGSAADCPIVAPLSAGGTVCTSKSGPCVGCLEAVDWAGETTTYFGPADIYDPDALSPDSRRIAGVLEPATSISIIDVPSAGGSVTTLPLDHSQWVLGWMDATHLVVGVGLTPQIVDVTNVSKATPIAASGRFVAPLPNDVA